MNTKIILSSIVHKRYGKIEHFFKYKVPSLFIDLDELDIIKSKSKIFSINGRSCTDPIRGIRSIAWLDGCCFSSSERLYMANSDTSSRMSFRGFHKMICRHSSLPIDPPAPVTKTVFSAMVFAMPIYAPQPNMILHALAW